MNIKEERVDYFDNLKGLLIFLVVLGHFLEIMLTNSKSTLVKSAYLYIYCFHMPLFVFVSGYLSKKSKDSDMTIVKLFVVFILFQILQYLLDLAFNPQSHLNIIVPKFGLWYFLSLALWKLMAKIFEKIKFRWSLPYSLALLRVLWKA